MADKKTFFRIEHIDSLGQGVSKINEKVHFIKNVLPGEEGETTVAKERKGVAFLNPIKSDKLTKVSENRINPLCEHFDNCPSCHFLHTTYQNEITIKKVNLERQLKFAGYEVNVETIESEIRTGYRNRIQLHYSIKNKKLGQIDSLTDKIIEIPKCIIAKQSILTKLKDLYEDSKWTSLVKDQPKKGHIEIYEKDGKAEISLNNRYAFGGFSQVNENINLKLKKLIQDNIQTNSNILDLFGGNGNLSESLNFKNRLVVDIYDQTRSPEFLSLNLYDKKALETLLSNCKFQIDSLIIDPPRSGLKNLNEFINKIQPKAFIYVSCNSNSLCRDIKLIDKNYQLNKAILLDMFPGTFHFETILFFNESANN